MIYLPIATATTMPNITNHLNAQNFFKGSTMEEEKKKIGLHHSMSFSQCILEFSVL